MSYWIVIFAVGAIGSIFMPANAASSSTTRLGSNLIMNPSFETPDLFVLFSHKNYQSISGWNCSNGCQLTNIPLKCLYYGQYCWLTNKQVFNLGFTVSNETLSQTVNITQEAFYSVKFKWASPTLASQNLSILLNSTLLAVINIDNISLINTSNLYSVNTSIGKGMMQFTFQLVGNQNTPNPYGIFIDQVELCEIITATDTSSRYQYNISDTPTKQALKAIFNNSFAASLNQLPGSRIIAKLLMRFYKNFDRLEYYFLHKQNLSEYSYLFLQSVYSMQDQKGTLFQLAVNTYYDESTICKFLTDSLGTLENITNFKSNYQDDFMQQINSKGGSFMANKLIFFYYELPVIVTIYLVCFLLFKLLFHYSISTTFRKYSFSGLLIIMIFEGNLEQFVFYYFIECKMLFSASFAHKSINISIILMGFWMVWFAFACFFLLRFYYGHKSKFLIEDYKMKMKNSSLFSESLESGMVPLLSGCFHALLFDRLLLITGALIAMEIFCVVFRISFLMQKIFTYPFRTILNIIVSIYRIFFLITLYVYNQVPDPAINEMHFYLTLAYIGTWMVEVLYTLVISLRQFVIFVRRHIRSRIANNHQQATANSEIHTPFKAIKMNWSGKRLKIEYKQCYSKNSVCPSEINPSIVQFSNEKKVDKRRGRFKFHIKMQAQ